MNQVVGSTTCWEPRLSNYKSYVKKKILPCRRVRHFIENCNDNEFNLFTMEFLGLRSHDGENLAT